MNITLPTARLTDINRNNERKECISRRVLVVTLPDGKPCSKFEVNFFMSRSGDGASPVYCDIYFDACEKWISGSGRAGGYGYHKESAAFADACNNCGLLIDRNISGVGNDAINQVLEAVAVKLGFTHYLII